MMRYKAKRASRISGSFFQALTTAVWEGRHRFRLFDEFFTGSLRGDEIISRDEEMKSQMSRKSWTAMGVQKIR